jgi:glycogen synthase
MYNYGVVSHAYVIVMKKYDCSLKDWLNANKSELSSKLQIILKIFWQVMQTLILLH